MKDSRRASSSSSNRYYCNVRAAKSECSETESSRPLAAPPSRSSSSDRVSHGEPLRPPRACDRDDQALPNYCNLPPVSANDQAPPILPRRQPHLRSSPFSSRRGAPPPPPPTTQAPLNVGCGSGSGFGTRQSSTLGHRRKVGQSKRRRGGQAGMACQCKDSREDGHIGNASTLPLPNYQNHPQQQQQPPQPQSQPHKENGVVLLYSRHCPGAIAWANYLDKLYTELFKNKGKMKVRHLPLEDLSGNVLPPQMEDEIFQCRLQLILLSPTFLQFIFKNPSLMLGRLLNPDRVLAIMLGVQDSQIMPEHRAGLVSFSHWIHLEAKDHDLEFVQTVLYFSTQILNRSSASSASASASAGAGAGATDATRGVNGLRRRQSSRSAVGGGIENGAGTQRRSESSLFHVHPKKLTENHSRLMIIFETPQSPRSRFRFRLELFHEDCPDVDLDGCWRFSNPYNIQVTVPSRCFPLTTLAGLRVEVDGVDQGFRSIKLESTLGELEQLLRISHDPVNFMCQTLHISTACRDDLDQKLAVNIQSKIPKDGLNPLWLSGKDMVEGPYDKGEFPTLLHFSASYGLISLTRVLLTCPGADLAVETKNANGFLPVELARRNGHDDLADLLVNHKPDPSTSSPHIYDYIHQSRPFLLAGQLSRDAVVDNNNITMPPQTDSASAYQVPPPPRKVIVSVATNTSPVIDQQQQQQPSPYLDMSGSGSGSEDKAGSSATPSPKPRRRASSTGGMPENGSGYKDASHRRPKTMRHWPMSPRNLLHHPEDPFGTLRASRRSHGGGPGAGTDTEEASSDDVFLPPSSTPIADGNNNKDPFGTLRANQALIRKTTEVRSPGFQLLDYRGGPETNNVKTSYEQELAVTNELLALLDDFRNKSYTVKEMETMFDSWRRKAAIYDLPHKAKVNDFDDLREKIRRYKAKLFKLPNVGKNLAVTAATQEEALRIRSSENTRVFKKPEPPAPASAPAEPSGEPIVGNLPIPPEGNETIVEQELSILNETEMTMVVLPPTPQKPAANNAKTADRNEANNNTGISTQILPLSRLSLSGSSPPTSTSGSGSDTGSPPALSPSTEPPCTPPRSRSRLANKQHLTSPVREKLLRLRRSLTEPLLQYFHELQVSPECEEPEVLNTPRSLTPLHPLSPRPLEQNGDSKPTRNVQKKSRNLFAAIKGAADKEKSQQKCGENVPPPPQNQSQPPPPIVTDM